MRSTTRKALAFQRFRTFEPKRSNPSKRFGNKELTGKLQDFALALAGTAFLIPPRAISTVGGSA
jgi:hypothetical protein